MNSDHGEAMWRLAKRAQLFEDALHEALSVIGALRTVRPKIPEMPTLMSVVEDSHARTALFDDIKRVSMSARDAARRGGSYMCGFLLGMTTDAARESRFELHAKQDSNHGEFPRARNMSFEMESLAALFIGIVFWSIAV